MLQEVQSLLKSLLGVLVVFRYAVNMRMVAEMTAGTIQEFYKSRVGDSLSYAKLSQLES